ACRIGRPCRHAVAALGEPGEGGREASLDVGVRLGQPERFLDNLDALALQHVGKERVVLEKSVIELSDQPVLAPIPVVDQRRDDAARLELVVEADALEQLQGCGMVRPRARYLFEEIVLAQRFDQADLHVRLRQGERQTKPYRSGADDDYAVGGAAVHLGVVERATLRSSSRPEETEPASRLCASRATSILRGYDVLH